MMESVVTVKFSDGSVRQFARSSVEAYELAAELTKQSRTMSVEIDGNLFDNRCLKCVPHIEGECDVCHGPSRNSQEEGGAAAGYFSVKPTHFHEQDLGGHKRVEGVHLTLCYNCYQADRLVIYGVPA